MQLKKIRRHLNLDIASSLVQYSEAVTGLPKRRCIIVAVGAMAEGMYTFCPGNRGRKDPKYNQNGSEGLCGYAVNFQSPECCF